MRESLSCLTVSPWPATREPGLDLAFELLGADVYARALRARGRRVRLVVGQLASGTEGAADGLRATLNSLDITPDGVVSSAEARHVRVAKALFLKLARQGDIYRAAPEGEDAFFLAAGKRRKAILDHIRAHPECLWPPDQHEAVVRLLSEGGAADPCVARRRVGPGTPVPAEAGLVLEPWFDTLVTHLTGCEYLDDTALFESLWPPAVQVVTAAALGIHAVAWPALLAALGLPPPQRLVVRGTLHTEESSDAGRPDLTVSELATRRGADATRYALLTSAGYLTGGRVSSAQLARAADAPFPTAIQDLVDTVVAALQTERGGVVPAAGALGAAERQLLQTAGAMAEAAAECIDAFDFQHALSHIGGTVTRALDFARRTASVGDRTARQRDAELFTLAEASRRVAWGLAPFVPRTTMAICRCLGLESDRLSAEALPGAGAVPAGTRIRRPDGPLPLARGGGETRPDE